MNKLHILWANQSIKLSEDNYHSSVFNVVSCFCIKSDGMPVRCREAGQVGVKGIVMYSVSVCVIFLVPVGCVFLLRMFDVRSKMGQ